MRVEKLKAVGENSGKSAKAIIRAKYYLNDKNKPTVEVRVMLEADDKGNIKQIFRDADTEFLGEELIPKWGVRLKDGDNVFRMRIDKIEGDNWDEIKQKVRVIEIEVETVLERVIRKNKGLISQKPRNELYDLLFAY